MGMDVAESWDDARRARAALAISRLADRQRIVDAVDHPAALAKSCDPSYVVTPAIDLLSRNVETVLRSRRRRLMITMGPQEGKSSLCAVWTPLRALQLHPNWRIMLLTYADGLAEEHSRVARSMILEFGSGVKDALTGDSLPDKLGLSLHPEKATAANWRIREGDGGLVAAGRDATITGKRSDLLVIDDPFKNMQEADSAAIRAKVWDWYKSVALTRLAPGASVILINTRWNPSDLSGMILAGDAELPPHQREWRYLNIPAISHPALPDALGRLPGVAMESARGRTEEDFRAIERTVGRRVWNALYQGAPTPPEGGLFSQAWFDAHRMTELPDRTRVRIVAVDPSESGDGDEAGVIGAALLYPPSPEAETAYRLMADPDAPPLIRPQIALTHDRSARMTSDQWAAAAVQLALDTDAAEIYIETYTAGTTYVNVVRNHIRARIRESSRDRELVRRLSLLVDKVRGWRGTGDAVARSGVLRQACEVGTCVVVGDEMTEMEDQAVHWIQGRHQPDRVAAAVIAHDRLTAMAGQVVHIGSPLVGRRGRGDPEGWSRRVG